MKYLFTFLFVASFLTAYNQALRDISYVYEYNPAEPFSFNMKTARESGQWTVYYTLTVRDTSLRAEDFVIQWETRGSIADKEGKSFSLAGGVEANKSTTEVSGSANLAISAEPVILVARVIQTSIKRAWLFYEMLEPNLPVDGHVMVNGSVLMDPYIKTGDRLVLQGSQPRVVSFYNDMFPPALPPFAEAQAQVSRGMKTDSTFFVNGGESVNFSKTGLYLIQKDTNATEGIALRVEEDYPKLARIPSLAGPLVYICTKQEYDRLRLAKNDKKAFDRIILSITNDTERARKLMRTFFRRVEVANQYFTSYKEGWKSDRGMIFIVFGMPEKVLRFNDREVWTYDNDVYKVTFNFTKSSSIFDPENYVLIRDKKYRDTWYEVIDLWRNARF
jgi:GWxTD domain-containing protein